MIAETSCAAADLAFSGVPSYNFAPGDDQPWLIPAAADYTPRLLRGGSWLNNPRNCRSSYRDYGHPGYRYRAIGFRVCCLPQD